MAVRTPVTARNQLKDRLRPVVAAVFGVADAEITDDTLLGEFADDALDFIEIQMDIERILDQDDLFLAMANPDALQSMTFRELIDYVLAPPPLVDDPEDEDFVQ